jgi:serine/threonine protein kinase/Tol biopolymer transport system component
MGEVYRARDTKLHRDVAVKVLPELFALDPERLVRFEREAQVLAALNHPNIAHIYGVEDRALVMELVDGEDLAQRIARGALPLDEALPIAKQIAEALEAAHESGIVHRDLKPANIKLRNDGVVKVLDFGLAKAADAAGALNGEARTVNSPTFTSPAVMTRMGVILGTAAYMSPEQARGKGADRRSDIWAFGVVLYEMLTGRMAFEGETVTDVLAAIVTREPDWNAVPPQTPPAIRRLLQRCLTRDPRKRLSDAGEARYQIEEALTPSPAAKPSAASAPSPRHRLALAALAAIAVLFAVAAAVAWWTKPTSTPDVVLHYTVEAPMKASINLASRPAIALSPDGRQLAFVATIDGITRLYVRAQNEFDARALAGTDGASEPVFSPDGRWLAFYANNALSKMSIDGGAVETLGRVNDPRGLSWDTPETLTYSPEATGTVFQLDARGGTPKAVTTRKGEEERTHRWPQALPGNKAVLFTVGAVNSPDNYDGATIEAVVVATGERRVLIRGAAMARYLPPGYLLFARAHSVFAVRFNPDRLEVEGAPVLVMQGVAGDSTTGATDFTFSQTGTFAYFPGSAEGTQHRLVWMSREGALEAIPLPTGAYFDVRLSPDGSRVALQSVAGGGSDIWVHDFEKKTFTRLTFGGQNRTPVWSRDGSAIYFVSLDPMGYSSRIMRRPADGSRGAEPLTRVKVRIFLKDVSADGQTALIDYSTNANKTDIGTVPLGAGEDRSPTTLVSSEFDEFCATLSPDGRWIAYQSDESSRPEIFVRAASGSGRWQVSSDGGEEPHWSASGDELYFRNDTLFMAAHITPAPVFQYSQPRMLFGGLFNLRAESGVSYAVDPKGTHFLMIRATGEDLTTSSIRVITNWSAEFARIMARPAQ